MAGKYYWLKEIDNPRFGAYYVAYDRITVRKAKSNDAWQALDDLDIDSS